MPHGTFGLLGGGLTGTLPNPGLIPNDASMALAHQLFGARRLPSALTGKDMPGGVKIVIVQQGTTTYTPTPGARALYAECVAGGGGGGGGVTGATATSAGAGGAGGGYSAKWIAPSLKSSYTVAVGLGGTAGAAGNNTGGTGGDTTFDSASVCTAKGGLGGQGGGVAATTVLILLGGQEQAGQLGDLIQDNIPGQYSLRLSATIAISGGGGWSPLGAGGVARINQGAGPTGGNFGGGGAGGLSLNGGASVAGGAGANGILRVWEFF